MNVTDQSLVSRLEQEVRYFRLKRETADAALQRGPDAKIAQLADKYAVRIRELEQELFDLRKDRTLERRAAVVALKEAKEQVIELKKEATESQSKIDQLKQKEVENTAEIARLKLELDGEKDQSALKDNQINDANQRRERLEQRVNEMEQELVRLRQELADRKELDRLIAQCDECRKRENNILKKVTDYVTIISLAGTIINPIFALGAVGGAASSSCCCNPAVEAARKERVALEEQIRTVRIRLGEEPPRKEEFVGFLAKTRARIAEERYLRNLN